MKEHRQPATRHDEVRLRRRVLMRVGFVVLTLATLASGTAACIFEQSDYKGGGRLDKGAAAKTAEPDPTDTTQPPDDAATTPPFPYADTGAD